MTYPQSQAETAAKNGQEFWRLNTLLTSPGDIYECDQGLAAIAIGPLSDIAKVRATYYDELVRTTSTNALVVSPARSFSGRLDASLDKTYPQAIGKKGRILLSIDDTYDPAFVPLGFNGANDIIEVAQPRLDVIGYLSAPPTLTPARVDGDFLFNYLQPPPGAGSSYVLVPTYGRRAAFVNVFNFNVGASTLTVRGVNQTTRTNTTTGISQCIETPIVTAAVVAAGGVNNTGRINLAAYGFFDCLLVGVTNGGSIRIITTDQAA